MTFFHALLIFLGLSLDSFVLMMNKAATIRNLTLTRSLLYTLIYACVDVVALLCGYGISMMFKDSLKPKGSMVISCLIIFAIGIYLCAKSWHSNDLEERLDPNFGLRECLKLAFETTLDTLFLGVCFSLLEIGIGRGVMLAFIVSFITIFVAMYIGYRQGSRYSKVFGMSGGILMIIFSLYLLVVYVVL